MRLATSALGTNRRFEGGQSIRSALEFQTSTLFRHCDAPLWVQGEMDYVKGTNEKDYRDRFMSLVSSLRSHGVAAPVYVAVATKCLAAANGGTRFPLCRQSGSARSTGASRSRR
jgi:hypothetical protein